MMKTASLSSFGFLMMLAISLMAFVGMAEKPWVIVESHQNIADDANLGGNTRIRRVGNGRRGLNRGEQDADFRRILIDKIASSGRFRCSERDTIQSMLRENAMGADAEVCFTSADRGIKWTIRESSESYPSAQGTRGRGNAKGLVLTVTLSYVNLTAGGNGEVLDSDTVVVRERFANGVDMYTYAARNAARAILFKLATPRIIDVSRDGGGLFATVDYGSDFFARGEHVVIMERVMKSGVVMSNPKGRGTVVFTDKGATRISVESGFAAEGWNVAMADEDLSAPQATAPTSAASVTQMQTVQPQMKALNCTQCRGTGHVITKTPCQQCNGRGRIANPAAQIGAAFNMVSSARGNRRRVSRGSSEMNCPSCNRQGYIRQQSTCPSCNGSGRVYR